MCDNIIKFLVFKKLYLFLSSLAYSPKSKCTKVIAVNKTCGQSDYPPS